MKSGGYDGDCEGDDHDCGGGDVNVKMVEMEIVVEMTVCGGDD